MRCGSRDLRALLEIPLAFAVVSVFALIFVWYLHYEQHFLFLFTTLLLGNCNHFLWFLLFLASHSFKIDFALLVINAAEPAAYVPAAIPFRRHQECPYDSFHISIIDP